MAKNEKAIQPEDLDRLFLERANSGDLDGVVSLYDTNAQLALPSGEIVSGANNIRRVYEELLAAKTQFQGEVQPAIRNGNIALTSTRLPKGITIEVAQRQPDGSWLWIIDQPNIRF